MNKRMRRRKGYCSLCLKTIMYYPRLSVNGHDDLMCVDCKRAQDKTITDKEYQELKALEQYCLKLGY